MFPVRILLSRIVARLSPLHGPPDQGTCQGYLSGNSFHTGGVLGGVLQTTPQLPGNHGVGFHSSSAGEGIYTTPPAGGFKIFLQGLPMGSRVPVGPGFSSAFRQWTIQLWLHSSVLFRPRQNRIFLYSDASLTSCGSFPPREASGIWTVEEAWSLFYGLELKRSLLRWSTPYHTLYSRGCRLCQQHHPSCFSQKQGGGRDTFPSSNSVGGGNTGLGSLSSNSSGPRISSGHP